MAGFVRWINGLIRELRRRRVIRVAVVYATTAFVILQLGEILVAPFGLGDWSLRLITLLLILGFPLAVGLAWVYNITEDGVVREDRETAIAEESAPQGSPLTSNALIVGLLIVAIGLLLYPRVFSSEQPTATGHSAASDTAQIDERSIAVLPFEPLSSGEDSKTFARGVHDDLLTRLSNISNLTVISRTSVERYRDTDLPLPAIADSLGVRWVMEGGVQVLGDQIQVNAQLIDPRSDAHVWAEDYRRDLTAEDLFAIQGEITGEIADALKTTLTAGEQDRITGAPTEDLRAYRLYAKGRSQLGIRTEDAMRRAVDYFQRALREDSTFALAWAGLADAAILVPTFGPDTLDVPQPGYKAAARRALKLDPDLAEAHASLGGVYTEERNAPAALGHLSRAVDLKPSYAQAHEWVGLIWFVTGRSEKALRHYRLAVELNPHLTTARTMLIQVLLTRGAVEKAEAQLGRFTQEQRLSAMFEYVKKDVLYYTGQWDRLEALAKKHLESEVGHEGTQRFYLARIAARRGDTAVVRKHVAKVPTLKDDNHSRPYWKGLFHAILGEPDSAFAAWRKIREWGPFSSWSLRYYWPDLLGPLREDPRYEDVIRKINRYWGLNPDGSIPEPSDTSMKADPEADA